MPSNETIYQSTVLLAIILGLLTLLVPRRYFLVPFIIAACFVPSDQRIMLMGLDFKVLRMIVAVGVLRVLLFGECRRLKLNRIDRLLLMWVLCGAAIYSIQWNTAEAVINRAGVLFDAAGLYWLFRQNIRSWDDLKHTFRLFAVGAIILLPFVLIEWSTGSNPFVFLGKVITSVREENFRCQGAFPHSIMLGLFWAILAPMFLALARTETKKTLYVSAFASSVVIVMATASSTPILVLILAIVAYAAFNWRQYTAAAALALAAVTAALHITMNAPVWHFLARINVIGGSTGWHRYNLIDKAISNFNEWMVIGCRSTDHWGWGLGDVTNQYVLEGVRGGAATLILFILMIYAVLKTLVASSLRYRDPDARLLSWALFSMMIAHCVGFIGVSYFGQIQVLWYMTLATASLLADRRTDMNRQSVSHEIMNGGKGYANHSSNDFKPRRYATHECDGLSDVHKC